MKPNKKLLLTLLLPCAALLVVGYGKQTASDSHRQDLTDLFIVNVDSAAEFSNHVLEIEGKYRIEIRDESGDLRPDHWDLYIDGVLRCKRWSPLGYGAPSRGEIYDSDGKLAVKIVTKY